MNDILGDVEWNQHGRCGGESSCRLVAVPESQPSSQQKRCRLGNTLNLEANQKALASEELKL